MKSVLSFLVACILVAGTVETAFTQTTRKSAKIGDGVYELVYNEKDNQVYVTTTRGNSEKPAIYVLDPATMTVKDSIVLETGAFGLGINQKTQTLYGTATRAGAVIAVDIRSKKTIARITNGKEGGHTREAVVDEKTNKVYVSDVSGGVWVIDGKTNTFSHMLKDIKGATGLAVDSERNRLYTISKSKVVFYDLKTDAVIDSFSTGGERPINIALDTKRNRLLVSHQGSGNVTVLDATNGSVLKTIPAGEGALGTVYSPAGDRIFVANRGAGTVTVINAADYSVLANVNSGSFPNTVVVDSKGTAYVSNKAKGAGRPKPGEKPQRSSDPDGDNVTAIHF